MKDKKNIFSEWINKIRNRNRPNEGIYYVSQRLRRTAKVVIPELNGLQDSINGVNDRLQTLDNNAAKKNTANTFSQKQTFRNEVEFGTSIKAGFGGGVVNITPEDNSSKTLSIQRFDINMNNKKISNLATPTSNNDATNKSYVDAKSTELTNEITNLKEKDKALEFQLTETLSQLITVERDVSQIKDKNTEQDSEITNIKKKNNTQESEILELNKRVDTQTNEINNIKQKNTQQDSNISGLDNRVRTLENKPGTDISGLTQRVSTNETDIRTNASNIRGLESAKGQVYLTYEKRVSVSLSNKQDEFVNIGGLDITRFNISFDMIPPLTYITNMQAVGINFFIISFTKYTSSVYKVVFAKKAATTYPSNITIDIDFIRLISQVDGRTGEEQ